MSREYFSVNVNRYSPERDFFVVRPASLNKPKNNAVMFILEDLTDRAEELRRIRNCLIFWPETVVVHNYLFKNNAICVCSDPRNRYCRFFLENNITYLPQQEEYHFLKGSFIANSAKIGKNPHIMPGAYIGGDVIIGDNAYIGAGAKLVGEITIGNNVVIRENAVIGADGLTTDRDENGSALTMPQFGGVTIEDDVQIGALVVIARGAIDNTVICHGCKIDNSCFISHNVRLGANTFVVGETIFMGSSSIGEQSFVSGNSTIRNGIQVGKKAYVGMGSNVVKDVDDESIIKGNPAK